MVVGEIVSVGTTRLAVVHACLLAIFGLALTSKSSERQCKVENTIQDRKETVIE